MMASAAAVFAAGAQAQQSPGASMTSRSASAPAGALPLDEKMRRGLALQVALDRAGFSPGAIDGRPGPNTDRAVAAFSAVRGALDLDAAYEQPVTSYTITAEDMAGPFVSAIPDDMMAKAELSSLAYTSVVELLAERFHTTPGLLKRLNPNTDFEQGAEILVPAVEPFIYPDERSQKPSSARGAALPAGSPGATTAGRASAGEAVTVTVTVTERTRTLQVQDRHGVVIFHAPVTVGSDHDPLPVGEWTVNGVQRNPVFHYNPQLFWDADPSHAKAKVPAGPNNPVGAVWIDLSKEHYGIHGTPEPERVGYTESHGCIRLTNWDAMRVAALVGPGTKVILR